MMETWRLISCTWNMSTSTTYSKNRQKSKLQRRDLIPPITVQIPRSNPTSTASTSQIKNPVRVPTVDGQPVSPAGVQPLHDGLGRGAVQGHDLRCTVRPCHRIPVALRVGRCRPKHPSLRLRSFSLFEPRPLLFLSLFCVQSLCHVAGNKDIFLPPTFVRRWYGGVLNHTAHSCFS